MCNLIFNFDADFICKIENNWIKIELNKKLKKIEKIEN